MLKLTTDLLVWLNTNRSNRRLAVQCTAVLLFDRFGLEQTSQFVANSTEAMQLNPNKINRGCSVQWYFPLSYWSLFCCRERVFQLGKSVLVQNQCDQMAILFFAIFGHLEQWKFVPKYKIFAIVGSKCCQLLSSCSIIANTLLKLCLSGEISLILVTLYRI